MATDDKKNYLPAQSKKWSGRVDGTTRPYFRWHQLIECINLEDISKFPQAVVFLGFCCDEGIRRNHGRIGAQDAPDDLRNVLAKLPVNFHENLFLFDAGDVFCYNNNLELAQKELADRVSQILRYGGFPVLFGGGHELTYAHFQGIKNAFDKSVGIINIDAHLDIREIVDGQGNSGTSFYQIAEESKSRGESFHYLALGIQDISNTQALFDYADQNGVQIIRASEIINRNLEAIIVQIQEFGKKVDQIYLTIDLDAFTASYAPGVSSPAFNGIIPGRTFQKLFSAIIHLPNLISVDIAELNPVLDIDQRTTKLAADMIFKIIQKF